MCVQADQIVEFYILLWSCTQDYYTNFKCKKYFYSFPKYTDYKELPS